MYIYKDNVMNREFKKPDLNAPRRRRGACKIVTVKLIEEFKKKYPQYSEIDLQTGKDILNTFHGKLWNHALHNRDGVELLEGLGYIFLGTCKNTKKIPIDFKKSVEQGVKLRHRNFDSDNYIAKIFYTNFASKYKFKNRELWYFKGTRDFTRSVCDVYRANWKLYVQVENEKNISEYIKNIKKRDFFKRIGERPMISDSYNEFDLN